jgi:hypothetical protein
MSYKQRASADREAIFGPPPPNSGGSKKSTAAGSTNSYKSSVNDNRAVLFGEASPTTSSSIRSVRGGVTATARFENPTIVQSTNDGASKLSSVPVSSSPSPLQKRTMVTTTLSGAAKDAKMKEAEEYRKKAKAAMEKTFFTRPDPIVASTYYKRVSTMYDGYDFSDLYLPSSSSF